jgi:hypothetical protein
VVVKSDGVIEDLAEYPILCSYPSRELPVCGAIVLTPLQFRKWLDTSSCRDLCGRRQGAMPANAADTFGGNHGYGAISPKILAPD